MKYFIPVKCCRKPMFGDDVSLGFLVWFGFVVVVLVVVGFFETGFLCAVLDVLELTL